MCTCGKNIFGEIDPRDVPGTPLVAGRVPGGFPGSVMVRFWVPREGPGSDFGSISTESVPYDTSHGAGTGITTIPGSADASVYSSHRWFEGIDSTKNAGSSEVNDPAKLKCHVCDVQRELFWNSNLKIFQLEIFQEVSGRSDLDRHLKENKYC